MVRKATITSLAALSLAAGVPALAGADAARDGSKAKTEQASKAKGKAKGKATFPQTIALPTGWQPEGIAAGPRQTLLSGSMNPALGGIVQADPKRGTVSQLVPNGLGRIHRGIKYDKETKLVFAAGALVQGDQRPGTLFVYDGRTGKDVAVLNVNGGFVNDVAIGDGIAYFTDSTKPVVYALPFSKDGVGEVRTIALTGVTYTAGNNANGIVVSPDGDTLLLGFGNTGKLYRVDAATGAASEVPLNGADVTQADGLLLKGSTLYVVRNRSNQIAVLKVRGDDFASVTPKATITDPDFAVPTTIARVHGKLYAVNAKFGIANPATQPFEIVRVGSK